MSCTKVVAGNSVQTYGVGSLYQGDFLELDNDLQYVRHARIIVMKDKVCLAGLSDGHEGLQLDKEGNDHLEISRSCVNIDLVKNSPYTFKLSVKHPENSSSVYQLCDREDSWPDFLKSFDLRDRLEAEESGNKTRVLPKVTFEDMDDYFSDSESEGSSLSESSSADDIGLPRCLTLCVRGQGLGAMSTFNVNNAMMMMNPRHVRRLTKDRDPRRGSIDFFGFPDSNEALRQSNSYPQLNYGSKSERSRSLPNVTDLDSILVDEDLRYGNLKPKRNRHLDFGYYATGAEETKTAPPNTLKFLSSPQYRTEFGRKHASTNRERVLNEQIGRLIAQPSSIKFSSTAAVARKRNENNLVSICESVPQESFDAETIKPNDQAKSRAYEVIDTSGGKFKLSFRKFWKRREKLKLDPKPENLSQHETDPDHLVFVNKLAVDYKCHVASMPSYAVGYDRRGGIGNDASCRRDPVTLSAVTRQSKDCSAGKDTIRKKIVKRILSPITILRSVSEEEKSLADFPQTEVESSVYQSKSRESVSQRCPKKLLDMNPLYLAQELTLIDKELLIRIPWSELSTCGWMTKHKYLRSPNVMSMVEFFNRIALVVASEILFEVDPIMRVRVISKVIQVASKLRSMGNFNSLKALLGGLQCTPIYRLKETWKEVSSKRKKNFRDLSKLMSEEDNFAAYRQELDNFMSQGSPCLPFLGDFLTQIAQTQTYLACRKKESPDSQKNAPSSNESNESEASPTTETASLPNGKQSPVREHRQRTSLGRRRTGPVREKEYRFSKSSPNLPASCTRTCERTPHYRMNRFRRCRSWQHSNDSGIQVNNSNNSSLSASSNSFLTSNTSLVSESFACHTKSGTNEDRVFNSSSSKHRDLGRSSSTSTPISLKNSVKVKLRRHRSVSEKCLSVSESGSSLKARMSFLRSFRRSKSMDQAPSSESIQRLYSVKMENGGSPGKSPKLKKCKSPEDTGAESGTELQLWHFHMAAIQYNFPSRAHIKQFLLTTSFNTEEDNYKLSMQREPPTRKRATTVS